MATHAFNARLDAAHAPPVETLNLRPSQIGFDLVKEAIVSLGLLDPGENRGQILQIEDVIDGLISAKLLIEEGGYNLGRLVLSHRFPVVPEPQLSRREKSLRVKSSRLVGFGCDLRC